jgi:uncharacterized protein (DUF849 family)
VAVNGTLITVAPTGAETAKVDAPGLPVTLEELVSAATACEAAGAAVVHVHVRDHAARPTLDVALLRDTVAALRAQTSLIVQLSTGGAVSDSYEDRLRVLDAEPDGCSLTCGTVNFGDDVFMNPWPFMVELYRRTQEQRVVPEFELFDSCGEPYGGHVHCDLVMGVPGGMPGTAPALVAAVRALPADATWSATGVGRTSLPVALAALSAGGHLRVGMEDTLTFARGRPVRDNAELVERAAQLATLAQRPPVTPAAARDMLGIEERRPATVGVGTVVGTPLASRLLQGRAHRRADTDGGRAGRPVVGGGTGTSARRRAGGGRPLLHPPAAARADGHRVCRAGSPP